MVLIVIKLRSKFAVNFSVQEISNHEAGMEDYVVSLISSLLGYIEKDLLMKVIVINGKYVKNISKC